MNGKLFVKSDDGEYQELGSLEQANIEEDSFSKVVRSRWNTNDTFIIKPFYKEWHKRKKGKHYVWDYKIKQGINPKIIKELLKGGKDE